MNGWSTGPNNSSMIRSMPSCSITHIIPTLEMGGAEMMLSNLLAGMDRSRWRVSVVSLRERGSLANRIEALGVGVSTIGISDSLPSPQAVWRLLRQLRVCAPEVLQGWMYHGNLAALVGRMLGPGRPRVVWNIRSDVFDFSVESRLTAGLVRLCALLSRRADRIIYNSRSSASGHANLGFVGTRAVIIPNGFDTRLFAPSPETRAAFRARVGVSDDTVLIGRIGRYHPVKDYPAFLEAAAILAVDHNDVRFVLAGPGVDKQNPELVRLIARFGLESVVHLLGEVSATNEMMASLDILCSSSAYGESFPNVLGEAMACGVPCVTTDLGDSAWVVGNSGYVVPPRNPRALAAGCNALIAAGREGRRRIGALGRERVVWEFSLERALSRYEDLYNDLLERGSRP